MATLLYRRWKCQVVELVCWMHGAGVQFNIEPLALQVPPTSSPVCGWMNWTVIQSTGVSDTMFATTVRLSSGHRYTPAVLGDRIVMLGGVAAWTTAHTWLA